MKHPDHIKNDRLYFQLISFKSWFNIYTEIDKVMKRREGIINYNSVELLSLFLLKEIAFLFDEKSPYSISNSVFTVPEINEIQKELMILWNLKKNTIHKILDGVGILNFDSRESIIASAHNFRRISFAEIIEFMKKINELFDLYEKYYIYTIAD